MVGITRVRDILYEFKVQYIVDTMEQAKEDFTRQDIVNKYGILKDAIPKAWIKRIENMEEDKQERNMYVMLGETEILKNVL